MELLHNTNTNNLWLGGHVLHGPEPVLSEKGRANEGMAVPQDGWAQELGKDPSPGAGLIPQRRRVEGDRSNLCSTLQVALHISGVTVR